MRQLRAVRTGGIPAARSPGPRRPDADLARCGESEELQAEQAVEALLRAAAVLVAAAGHDPDRVGCRAAACRLAGADAAELCGLAHRLASLAGTVPVHAVVPLATALDAFHTHLTAAVHAVRRCRTTRHPEGRCRFSSVPGQDGCAAVLRAAHAIG